MSEEIKEGPDWELIEFHYRAGVLTVRQIAKEFGISHTAIQKRAKNAGWTRSLQAKIQAKVILAPKDEMSAAGFLYVIYIDSGLERLYKIGMAKHFSSRFDQHQCSSPFDICVALCYFVGNMRHEERQLHQQFDAQRVRGEWFRLTGDDLDEISKRSRLA